MPRGGNPLAGRDIRAARSVDSYVGARIRLRRNMLGISQMEMGRRIGVTFQQVQKYERGLNRIGSSRLMQICHVLQVTPAWLFDGASREPRPNAAVRDMNVAFAAFHADEAAPRLVLIWPTLSPGVKRAMVRLMTSVAGETKKPR